MRLPGGWSGTAFILAYSAHSFRIRFAYPDAVLCPYMPVGLGIQKRHMHLPGGCGAGAGLLTFSHTVRIVSAYVSHTQTPFCAHLAILCSPTALYRSRNFILYAIRPREANDACAGATIRLRGRPKEPWRQTSRQANCQEIG